MNVKRTAAKHLNILLAIRHAFYIGTLVLVCLLTTSAHGQGTAINTTGAAADASAMLDVASTTRGMLAPRMSTTQRMAISSPAKGLLVYDSTLTSFYYYTGSAWASAGGSSLPSGSPGNVLYNNGSAWSSLPAGSDRTVLAMVGGTPTWVCCSFYTISATTGANGSVNPYGVWGILPGRSQAYTITPNVGYAISDVTVDGSSVGAVSTYTFTSVSANHTISASFAASSYPTYSITAASGSNGTVSPPGTTTISYAGSQTYSITPSAGYIINDVLVDGSSVGAVSTYLFYGVSANHTISASSTFGITATSGSNGTVSPPGTTAVLAGASQAYSITPNTGYHIAGVTVDGSSIGAVSTYTFTSVSASHTISASFAINTYSITATSGSNGTVTPPGTTTVAYSGTQTYSITPNTGYHITGVSVDGSSIGAVSTYTFTSVSANHTISASFAINTYSITASSGSNGTVTPPGTTTVAYSGTQTYSITPNTGYHITGVTVDGSSVGAVSTYTFTSVSANHTNDASFAINTYSITATSGSNGTVTPSGTSTLTYGSSQVYSITPNTGYHITGVTVDGSSVGAVSTYTFTSVSANHTISASFAVSTYSITATSGSNGTVTPSGTSTVTYPASKTYTITPNTGFSISGVTVDGASVGVVSTYTFTAVSSNHTITASFAHSVGTSFGGGIVAYILQPGDLGYSSTTPHGLIAAPSDQSTPIKWHNGTYLSTGALGTAIGAGQANTTAIVAAQGTGSSYAASICDGLTLGGFSDWYLPSRDELNILYINRVAIGGFAGPYANYWSSSELYSNGAWVQHFTSGNQGCSNSSSTLTTCVQFGLFNNLTI